MSDENNSRDSPERETLIPSSHERTASRREQADLSGDMSHVSPDRLRIAVVLAGGIGSRFWPVSTPERPKQLLPLGGPRPLIADAVERATALVGADNVRIVAGQELLTPFRQVLPEVSEQQFMLETVARSTGPALTWAAWEIERDNPGATMISLHADHVIAPLDGLRETVGRAARAAEERCALVCIGAEPDRPETGYGYIELGEPREDLVWTARRFEEKPALETARRYCGSGRHLWNTGIFVWRAADLLTAIGRWTPEIQGALPRLEAGDVPAFFAEVESLSIDVGVLERADCVEVVRATFAWDDVGSWNALSRTREADTAGNVLIGDTNAVESSGNVVWAEDGRVVLFGVEGLVVVCSGQRTLVTSREAAPDLKRLLERLRIGED